MNEIKENKTTVTTYPLGYGRNDDPTMQLITTVSENESGFVSAEARAIVLADSVWTRASHSSYGENGREYSIGLGQLHVKMTRDQLERIHESVGDLLIETMEDQEETDA